MQRSGALPVWCTMNWFVRVCADEITHVDKLPILSVHCGFTRGGLSSFCVLTRWDTHTSGTHTNTQSTLSLFEEAFLAHVYRQEGECDEGTPSPSYSCIKINNMSFVCAEKPKNAKSPLNVPSRHSGVFVRVSMLPLLLQKMMMTMMLCTVTVLLFMTIQRVEREWDPDHSWVHVKMRMCAIMMSITVMAVMAVMAFIIGLEFWQCWYSFLILRTMVTVLFISISRTILDCGFHS